MIRITVEHNFDGPGYSGRIHIHELKGDQKVRYFTDYEKVLADLYELILVGQDVEIDTITTYPEKTATRRMRIQATIEAIEDIQNPQGNG